MAHNNNSQHNRYKPNDSLRNTKNMVFLSIMIALGLVLRSVSISITPYMFITFAFVALMIIAKFFGPSIGCFSGIIIDILTYIITPKGPYIFGFTINSALSGLIYGLFLYNKKHSDTKLWRVILAKTIVQIFINVLLTTLWISLVYGQAYQILFYPRLIKNLIQLPIDIIVAYTSLRVFDNIYKRKANH